MGRRLTSAEEARKRLIRAPRLYTQTATPKDTLFDYFTVQSASSNSSGMGEWRAIPTPDGNATNTGLHLPNPLRLTRGQMSRTGRGLSPNTQNRATAFPASHV
ncbi:hypothetical protein GCM10023321_32150 [Pseudonocardia eucalypti]|uniref:Uncharacterized protein n=1 Tax=Pseudonocardia eucalypti TaxID=648755 RepID=A0ABP9Q4G0_9PSEU